MMFLLLILFSTTGVTQAKLEDLFEQLKSTEPLKRRTAITELGNLNDRRAIPRIIKMLDDEDVFVRCTAIDVLGTPFRAREAVPKLMELIEKDKIATVRQSAIVAVGYIGDKKAIPALIKALDDKDAGVKYTAANILGTLRATQAVKKLSECLKDKDVRMRRSVIYALKLILDKSSLPAVIASLEDPDPQVRSDAALICGLLKSTTTIETLIKLLKEDESKRVRICAAEGLAIMDNDAGYELAVKMLKDPESIIRIHAINVLSRIGDEKVIPLIKQLEKDKDRGVASTAKLGLSLLKRKFPDAFKEEKKK